MTNPLAIVSALPQELELLLDSADDQREIDVARGIHAWRGRLDGHDVVLAEAGIGKVAAAIVTTALMLRVEPRMFVFTGVAGGLDPQLGVGDVVVADCVVQHDAGVAEPDGLRAYQPGHLPFFNPTDRLGYTPPADVVRAACERIRTVALVPHRGRAPAVMVGTIVTGDVFVNSVELRRRLHHQFDALAVEMEGAALAQVADHFGVPFLVIRALSDLAGAEAPSPDGFTRFLETASANSASVVRGLLPIL